MVEPPFEADQRQHLARIERLVGDLVDQRDVLEHGEARNQIVELKHEADMLAPVARQSGVIGADQVMVAPARAATGRRVEPAKDVEQRRLARTDGPSSTTNSPS